VSGQKTTKTVFRMLMAWNDEKEGRWLAEQERSGWRLKAVRCFGYTFERSAAGDVAYRLDYGPARFNDKSEYFGLFHDAGWEHVGTRGLWQYFRKPVVDGQTPEIYTDPQYRIVMYQRLIGLCGAMLAMLIAITSSNLSSANSTLTRYPAFLILYITMMAIFAYGTARLLLVILRLRRRASPRS